MTLLVRDEADIVAANIDFHLNQGVDFVVAIDNGSRDGTREILDTYQRAGRAVVFDEPGLDYAQSEWVTRAAIHARDVLGADWIINNDADEFWIVPGGSLKAMLASTAGSILRCPRRNMVCGIETIATGDWNTALKHRVMHPVPVPALANIYQTPLPCPYLYLDLPPKVMVRAAGLLRIEQGNHKATYHTAVAAEPSSIVIYHYPVRSPGQLEKKVVQGGEAYRQNEKLPERTGWHWRRWYRLYREQGISAVLSEALPAQDRLTEDVAAGRVVIDKSYSELMADYGQPDDRS